MNDEADLPKEVSILDYIVPLLRGRWLIFVGTTLFLALGLILAMTSSGSYTATAYFMPRGVLGESNTVDELAGVRGKAWDQFRGSLEITQYYSVLLKTNSLMTNLLNCKFQVAGTPPLPLVDILFHGNQTNGTSFSRAIELLKKNITVGSAGGKVLTLAFSSKDAKLSADVVNTLLMRFGETSVTAQKASADASFIQERIDDVRKRINDRETSIALTQSRLLDADQPETVIQVAAMRRDAALDEKILENLDVEFAKAQIRQIQSERSKSDEIEVVDPATPPLLKSGMRKSKTVISMFFLGLFLSIALSYVLDTFRGMARSLANHSFWPDLAEAKRDLLMMSVIAFGVILVAAGVLFFRH